jgi:16S rRNA processing protein RimM
MTGRDRRVCVAVIGAPHGVRGEVRVRSHTGDPLDFAAYGPLETEDGARRLTVTSVKPGKGVVIARFEGVSDRDGAEALKNQRLYVDRDRLRAAAADEWYHADLIGLAVVDTAGAAVGRVTAVDDFGAGDLLEVALSGTRRTVLIPFTAAVVPVVDIEAGRIVVDPPAGLLDETPESPGNEDAR